jgi:hypothetical protein
VWPFALTANVVEIGWNIYKEVPSEIAELPLTFRNKILAFDKGKIPSYDIVNSVYIRKIENCYTSTNLILYFL